MTDHDALALEEYRALRATIRERGTMRLAVIAVTFVSWAVVTLVGLTLAPQAGLPSLAGLVVLAGGFEVAFATHVGVERIGRYLQVHFEAPHAKSAPCWEHAIMRVSPELGARTGGPTGLAQPLFIVVALLNLAALPGRTSAWPAADDVDVFVGLAGAALLHLVFLLRVAQATRYAARQRPTDLEMFEADRRGSGS